MEGKAQTQAMANYVRVSPRKARQLVDLIRGKSVNDALTALKFLPKAAAAIILKVVSSAAANAENNQGLKREALYISEIHVNQGPTLKRYRPRAMGRASRIHKRTSHITVVVQELKEAAKRGSK
ncbi:MAG: 50S ribosomal protein L22, partial [Candidatus Subteraquimicrobiales bacterium]|nr:50S ribosomal protein L22 [Candidatus Subteraquimicrobiales bacterium]